MGLAGLCLLHCLTASVLLALLASAGGILLHPAIHEIGLFLAIIFAALALGKGVIDHRAVMPAAIGGLGIGAMAGALALPHGTSEIFATMLGLAMLTIGHYLNHRASK